MLSLARVLVNPPRLLVVDELSLGLAPIIIDELYATLRRVNEAGTALLIIEQYVGRALSIAQSAVILQHGEVIYDGSVEDLGDVSERLLATESSARRRPRRAEVPVVREPWYRVTGDRKPTRRRRHDTVQRLSVRRQARARRRWRHRDGRRGRGARAGRRAPRSW